MDKIDRLAHEFENEIGPFSADNFPEARLVEQFGEEQRAEYLSAFCTWDYNRRVDQLVKNMIELAEIDDGYSTDYFYPPDVVGVPEDEMQAVFQSIGFRYGSQDAAIWQDNCTIITNKFGGSWSNLHEASGYHAPTLVKLLRDHDFKYIKGKKLAPFYARVVNDYVTELDDVWKLPIPVDTHIRRLSRDLFDDEEMGDDKIRTRWREIGEERSVSPAMVDGALWQIGYSWDDWGENYWEGL